MSQAICAPPALIPAERFTLWVLRRAQKATQPCRSGSVALMEMGAAFREVLPSLPSTAKHPSRDERRLLRATASVQRDDMALADNFLFKLALARAARIRLTQAVITLADFVSGRGHVLASPSAQLFSLPGAALQVARLHGRDIATTTITWPQSSKE